MSKSLKTITVVIDKGGGAKVDAKGFTGNSCLKETESLEEALGKVSDRHLKPEISKPVSTTDSNKVGA